MSSLHPNEVRVSRRGADGVLRQWSNAAEVPDGLGWQQVSKAEHPRVKSFIWFRLASHIQSDAKKTEDAKTSMDSSSVIQRFSDVVLHPFKQISQRWNELTRKPVTVTAGDRVEFQGAAHYAVGGVNAADYTVSIKDPITGAVKQVSAEEITHAPQDQQDYAVGDVVKLAAGVIGKEEYEAMVLGRDKKSGKYRVTLSTKTPNLRSKSFEVYPEGINAFVNNKQDDYGHVRDELASNQYLLASNHDKQVIETINRAASSGRTSISITEVVADAKARGEYIGANEVIVAVTELNRVNPNIQYNAANGNVFFGNSKRSIEMAMRVRKITPLTTPLGTKNIVQDSDKEAYGYAGQKVRARDGSVLEGIIDTVIGDIATIITPDKKAKTFKLDDLTDEMNRRLYRDPATPQYIGNVRNKDVFWILRDREHVNSYKIGDAATLMPGISNLARNKNQPLTGQVQAINDDGTIDMGLTLSGKKTTVRVFGRQLLKTQQMATPNQLMDYLRHNAEALYNKSFKVGNTQVEIGDKTRDSHGQKKVILTFADGADYKANEHVWLSPIQSESNRSGLESVIQALGSVWGKDQSDFTATLAPSRYFVQILDELFPNATDVHIARDTTTSPADIDNVTAPIKLSIIVDGVGDFRDKDLTDEMKRGMPRVRGKKYTMDRLHENYGNAQEGITIPATSLSDYNATKIWTDGESLFIKLSKLEQDFTSDTFPELRAHDAADTETKKPSFADVVNTPQYLKQVHWGAAIGEDGIRDSGVFTYDNVNDRYAVSLADYDKAHRFLRSFFGDTQYSHYMFETRDRGYYAPANNQVLKNLAAVAQKEDREILAAKEDTAPLGDEIDGFDTQRTQLRPYQNAAVRFMLKQPATLLAMDQGTGKSIAAIAATIGRLNQLNKAEPGKKHRSLIIAPASVAQTSWVNDLKKALPTTGKLKYNYVLLSGKDRGEGYKALLDPNDNTSIGVVSYHTFALHDWAELKDIGFDDVTLDEAQQIAPDENRGIITSRLQLLLQDTKYKRALTGTPLENKPEDLQAILGWLNPNLFGDAAKFTRDFVDMDYVLGKDSAGNNTKRTAGIRIKNWRALQSKLNQYMFRVEKSDLGDAKWNENATPPGRYVIDMQRQPDALRKWSSEYLSRQTTPQDKKRIGEMFVVPARIAPQYEVTRPDAKGKMFIHYKDNTTPLTTEGYGEYARMQEMVKNALREDYLGRLKRTGKPPDVRTYFTRMQQGLNDPSLLATAKSGIPERYQAFFGQRVPNPKLDRMMSIIAQQWPSRSFKRDNNGKIIIFSESVQTLNFLERELVKNYPNLRGKLIKFMGPGNAQFKDTRFKTRRDIESAFNNDPDFDYPIMLATKAAQTGVNLFAANTVINYDQSWNPADTEQRIDRAHRVRSLKDIVASNTAPAREVRAYNLAVLGADGDINSTIEARKMFTHWAKTGMRDIMVRGKAEDYKNQIVSDTQGREDVVLQQQDEQQAVEELLNVTHATKAAGRAYTEQAGRVTRHRELKKRQRELEKRYGRWAKYLRGYADISQPID